MKIYHLGNSCSCNVPSVVGRRRAMVMQQVRAVSLPHTHPYTPPTCTPTVTMATGKGIPRMQ